MRTWIAAGWMAGALATGGLAAEPLSAPAVPAAPILDGVLTDACWQAACTVDTLYLAGSATQARDTTVRLARDTRWLYLGLTCSNAHMGHVSQVTFQHDGSVQFDDSIELFFRPDTNSARSYQFMLNFANVGHEKRIRETGERETEWNPPWRTMTRREPTGWTAELAIPLYVFECGDLGGLRMNLVRNVAEIHLDPYGAKDNERRVAHTLKAESAKNPHDAANFLTVAGLGGFQPDVPFAPVIRDAAVSGVTPQGGAYGYDLAVTLDLASPVPGAATVQVLEDAGAGETVTHAETVDVAGSRVLTLRVPATDLRERAIRVALADPADGNLLASRALGNVAAFRVIQRAVPEFNYYTAESAVRIRLESGLPAVLQQDATLAIEVNGRPAGEIRGLQPVMTPEVPVSALALGDNTVTLRIRSGGAELAAHAVPVRRLEPRPGLEFKTDAFRRILVNNGQPFFTRGLYTTVLQTRLMAGMAPDDEDYLFRWLGEDIGFNTIARGDIPARHIEPFMRAAAKYGLNVIPHIAPGRIVNPLSMLTLSDAARATLPEPLQRMLDGKGVRGLTAADRNMPLADRLRIRRALYEEKEPDMLAAIEAWRGYPHCIGYNSVDEINLVNPDDRLAGAEWTWHTLRQADPYRPVWTTYARDIPHGDRWTGWFDVLGYDWYPCPYKGAGFYDEPALSSAWFAWNLNKRCRADNKVMFFFIGANGLEPVRCPVRESKAHMLCQAYTVIIYGARGIMCFTLTGVVGEEAWDALRTLNTHLKAFEPALLNGETDSVIEYPAGTFDPDARKFPMVNAAVYAYPDGRTLLLAANITATAVDTVFTVPGLAEAVRLFAPAPAPAASGGVIADTLEPYGVRAYTLTFDRAPAPVRVSVGMQAREDQRLIGPDIPGIVRQVMLGKNHIPNPCFAQQTNKGIPDFYCPYWCLTIDRDACKPGSSWFVDPETRWEGNPSLCMYRRPVKEPGYKTRGTLGVFYPPPSGTPATMTFSFYGKSEKPGGTLTASWILAEPLTFPLTTDWQRYQAAGTVAPASGASPLGGRLFLLAAGADNRVWISGLQLEPGEAATAFTDDSVLTPPPPVAADPGNLIPNSGAESSTVSGWKHLEDIRRGRLGVRRGAGRSGDYAFVYGGPPWPETDLIPVDPAKAYELTASFKHESPHPRSVMLGLFMHDRERRPIKPWNARADPGTRTELVAACAEGDTALRVKDAAGWKAGLSFAVAFGGPEDEPNFNVTPLGITAVTQADGAWTVALKQPCGLAFPAGTGVSQRRAGNYGIYFVGDATHEWTDIKGVVRPTQWWPGTAYVSVFVSSKGDEHNAELLMDDVSLRVREPNPVEDGSDS